MAERKTEAALLERARKGDRKAVGDLLERNRFPLLRLVGCRLDRRLRPRLDAADVVQETFLEAARRFDEYLLCPTVSVYVWLRFLALQKAAQVHRHHCGYGCRDVRREVPWDENRAEDCLARGRAEGCGAYRPAAGWREGWRVRPDGVARSPGSKLGLVELLHDMSAADRFILTLRHFEGLSTQETARVLGIRRNTAAKRYVRAIHRVRALVKRASDN